MAGESAHKNKKAKSAHAGSSVSDIKGNGKSNAAAAGEGKQSTEASSQRGRGGRGGRGGDRGRSRGNGRGRGRGAASGSGRGGRRGGAAGGAHQNTNAAEPGVNKLKASIRQVKRLLAKPNLAPDVQQEAERRLKALEEDVKDRMDGSVRKAWEERWKKVRFFERQKVMRKIKQLSRRLNEAQTESFPQKEVQDLEVRLMGAREWLNYIIHFPMTEPYLPLFASGFPSPFTSSTSKTQKTKKQSSKSSDSSSDSDEDAQQKSTTAPATSEEISRRLALRNLIRTEMRSGNLSNEPEVDLERDMKEGKVNALGAGIKRKRNEGASMRIGAKHDGGEEESESDAGLRGDDFFEGSDESDEDDERKREAHV